MRLGPCLVCTVLMLCVAAYFIMNTLRHFVTIFVCAVAMDVAMYVAMQVFRPVD